MSRSNTLPQDTSSTPRALAALAGRVLLIVVFFLSGLSKLAAPTVTIGKIQASGLPLAPLGLAIAVAIEILGSLALIAGYRTRWVAAGFVLYSLATAAAFHNNLADYNQYIHFFKNIAIAGGFLQVVAFGGGSFSLDGRLARAAPPSLIEDGAQ